MSAGSLRTGGVESPTSTTNCISGAAFWWRSIASHFTSVLPTGKNEPEG